MMPIFANPVGLWALLGIPTILAIHFLQQRSRQLRTSAWFLIEKLAPDSMRGRTWDQIRPSRQLFYQLLAVLLAAWVLAEPRWVNSESSQTVVIVLDASASMDAFRAEATAAAEAEVNAADGLAAHTTWLVMTTDASQPPLYRGPLKTGVADALAAWEPLLGQHETTPVLRLGRGLAGETGRMIFITHAKARTADGVRTVGVGKPIENVGFSGANAGMVDDKPTWSAIIRNHSATAQRRQWRIIAPGGQASPERSLELAPGELREITAPFADGIDELTVVLSGDKFTLDDQLPIVRPAPKPLSVLIEGETDAAKFFRRVAQDIEGVKFVKAGEMASFKIAQRSTEALRTEAGAGIFWPPADTRPPAVTGAAITPVRSPLVEGLSWQAWLGGTPYGFAVESGDTPLLWQSGVAMALLRPAGGDREKLLLAFDIDRSNALRLPTTVLFIRRFVESQRDAQRTLLVGNYDTGQRIAVSGLRAGEVTSMKVRPLGRGDQTVEQPRAGWRAPMRPGYFTIESGAEVLIRGAAQFADPRQGDFKDSETFKVETPGETKRALERNSVPDPFAKVWLAAIAALLLASWHIRRKRAPVLAAPAAVRSAA